MMLKSFKAAAPLYNNALRDSGFQDNVEYAVSQKGKKPCRKRSRVRRITWFNPLYNKNVRTRIGQRSLRLVDRHFLVSSKLHNTFNRSMVKVSYGCMPSMGTIIKCRNAHVYGAEHESNDQSRRCNCRSLDLRVVESCQAGRVLARPLFVPLSFPAPCTCPQSRDVPRERLGNEVSMRIPAVYDCERTCQMINRITRILWLSQLLVVETFLMFQTSHTSQ